MGDEADLTATVAEGEGGILHGRPLTRFAEVITRASEEAAEARGQLLDVLGAEGFVEAAATVGIFNGLVRVADATGIPLDDGTLNASITERASLGLNEFAGAASSELEAADASASSRDPRKLFGF